MSSDLIDNGSGDEISEIRKDLARNNVKRALNRLSDLVEAQGRACSKEVRTISILLMQDYARVELWQIGNRAPPDDISRIVGNISRRALELCDAIEDDQAQISFTPPDKLVEDVVGSRTNGPLLTGGTPSTSQPEPSFDVEAIIDARGISRNFGVSKFQLEPLDLKVMPGRILGIIGMNGSGKSTLLDILRGEFAPDTGQVSYPALSREVGDWTAVKRQIGFVAQRSPPWRGMVLSNLEYAAAVHGIKGEENVEWTNRLLARYGLTLYKDRRWSELSAGFRMRFDLALARVNKPKLLILDEPLGNLDPVSQQSILFDIVQLARSTRTAIIITSQHLYETEAVADEILLLAGGKRLVSYQPRSETYFEIYWPK
ncbi:MAG: ATP-binding cassette domain-containing protein, partial [Bradyrhizobium sp.]